MRTSLLLFALALAAALPLGGCGDSGEPVPARPKAAAPAHDHVAPHGGTLVTLGDHVAHLEVLLDPETGRLSAWVLDEEAEKPVRVTQKELVIQLQLEGGRQETRILSPVANALTGETAGDTSEFRNEGDAALQGVERFDGTVFHLYARGELFTMVPFSYPGEDGR